MVQRIQNSILSNSLLLYNYTGVYGVDKYDTKIDLLNLSFLLELIDYYKVSKDKTVSKDLYKAIDLITMSNPQLLNCLDKTYSSSPKKKKERSFSLSFDTSFELPLT